MSSKYIDVIDFTILKYKKN